MITIFKWFKRNDKKFRIVKFCDYESYSYVVQKKSFLGFWYNPDNIDAVSTGIYDTEQEAREAINRKLFCSTKIILNL